MTEDLTQKAKWLRMEILGMCAKAGVGHIASSLSCVEIITYLYYGGIIEYNPKKPKWDGRDRFILSKGHAGVALYPVLSDLGFFPKKEIDKFCSAGGILGGHPDYKIPGIEITSGSLGHGLGIGAGIALSARIDNKQFKTIVLMGDGELQEGSVWESAMFSGYHHLDNLWVIIDHNRLSCTDFIEKYLDLEPLISKWESFGWDARVMDGHSFPSIAEAFSKLRQNWHDKPRVIIANTVKGKGISFMESTPLAHSMIPSGENLTKAIDELCR